MNLDLVVLLDCTQINVSFKFIMNVTTLYFNLHQDLQKIVPFDPTAWIFLSIHNIKSKLVISIIN